MPIGGMAFYGQNQHPRLTTNYLNQLNRHGDPGAGVPVSTAEVSGSIVQEYLGFAGGKLTITNPWAAQFGDPAVGPIYGGVYMYVRVNPLDPNPLTRGSILFWQDELNYIVTQNHLLRPGGPGYNQWHRKIAGIAVNETFPGNWDFIQIQGIANVLFGWLSNSQGGVIGNGVMTWNMGSNTQYTPIKANTSEGGDAHQWWIGQAVLTAPWHDTISPVQLNIISGQNF